ncbi:kinase [Abyssisolibacter fermentans]|uniref:GHMP family kinase ATP-binding protein n=1 Tax=Abyssisolibacter fermentans TaxID=1766203 RepID=UPI00082AAC29|nr:kinase [Abyssisolibacter fermentans]
MRADYNIKKQKELISTYRNIGEGSSFGTFGELLQGVLCDNGKNFLVTFPIKSFSRATLVFKSSIKTLTVHPSYKTKSLRLAKMLMTYFGIPVKGRLIIDSDIEVGKGLASSSADLVATARSIESCFGINISNELLQSFMNKIEPSDGVMYPGVVSYYHRDAKLIEFLGELPPITILGIDEGGNVDTIEFNKTLKPFSERENMKYQELLHEISNAVKNQDLDTIGRISTESAFLNQKVMPKKHLHFMNSLCQEINGLGIIISHSGTCIGIMLSQENPKYNQQLYTAQERIRTLTDKLMICFSWNTK